MIRSFREYLAENISNGVEGGGLQAILNQFEDVREVVRYALYCAREVEDIAKDAGINSCNNAVAKWLNGNSTINLLNFVNISQNIRKNYTSSASDAYYTYASSAAASSASAAANCVVSSAYFVRNNTNDLAVAEASYAVWHASVAKSYNLHPDNETQRNFACKHFYNEYVQLAQNWMRRWENAPEDLKGISQISPEIIYDYLQDNPIVLSKVIPNKDGKYYLNISGMEGEFVGNSEEEVLSKVMGSGKREIVLRILSKIIGNDL